MKSRQQIAVFDSGIGGLSVLHEIIKQLPSEQYVYYADTDHLPYGTKTKSEIFDCVNRSVRSLASRNLKALVLACNTATSVAVNELRAQYDFPIIGMEPAVKPAIESSKKQVMVCATDRTIQEPKLHNLITNLDADAKVELRSLQPLVLLAEDFVFDYDRIYPILEKTFKNVDWNNFDYLVLGCTHFIYYKVAMSYYLPPSVKIIDGNLGTANRLRSLIQPSVTNEALQIEYLTSGRVGKLNQFEPYLELLDSI